MHRVSMHCVPSDSPNIILEGIDLFVQRKILFEFSEEIFWMLGVRDKWFKLGCIM